MQLSEKELKKIKKKIKSLFRVFILLYIVFIGYYLYYTFIWDQRIFWKNQIFGELDSRVVNYGYSTNDINDIVVDFDTTFMENEKYKNLSKKPYNNLSKDELGRNNPFNPYKANLE
jgi:hypothetical protein